MTSVRQHLDIQYIISALVSEKPIREIVEREQARLQAINPAIAEAVTKNVIIGVKRDLKAQKISLHNYSRDMPTYIYGVEEDNGGLPIFTGELDINEDRVFIINDVHSPLTDWDFANQALMQLQKGDYGAVLLVGDIIDVAGKSTFRKLVPEMRLTDEIRITREFMGDVLSAAKQAYYLRGNHEDRYMLSFEGDINFQTLANQIVPSSLRHKIIVSPYDRLFLTSGGIRWGIFHQKNVATDKLKVAEALATKYLCNVVVTHQHKNAVGMDRYNNWALASIGGLHSPEKTAYVQLKTTTSPVQEQGYGEIVNGKIKIWTPDRRIT